MESYFPSDGGLVSQGPSEAETPALELIAPREPTFVHLSASTMYGYLNHLLLNVIQQSLSSETLQTALNYLEDGLFQIWMWLFPLPSAGPNTASQLPQKPWVAGADGWPPGLSGHVGILKTERPGLFLF